MRAIICSAFTQFDAIRALKSCWFDITTGDWFFPDFFLPLIHFFPFFCSRCDFQLKVFLKKDELFVFFLEVFSNIVTCAPLSRTSLVFRPRLLLFVSCNRGFFYLFYAIFYFIRFVYVIRFFSETSAWLVFLIYFVVQTPLFPFVKKIVSPFKQVSCFVGNRFLVPCFLGFWCWKGIYIDFLVVLQRFASCIVLLFQWCLSRVFYPLRVASVGLKPFLAVSFPRWM